MQLKMGSVWQWFVTIVTCLVLAVALVVLPSGTAQALSTWTLQTSGTTDYLGGGGYGNGAWVIVGAYGFFYRSTDKGVTWTSVRDTSDTGFLNDAMYLESLNTWVAVGFGGRISTSVDRDTWIRQTTGVSDELFGVASDGINTVVVGKNGRILYSTNATVWTAATNTSSTLYRVAYGNGTFVAVGLSGTIRRSTDGGVTWNAVPSGVSDNLNGVGFDGARFKIVGANGRILTSVDDGQTWTASTYGTDTYNTVEYGNKKWVAVGNGGVIISSKDGTNWAPETSGTDQNLWTVAYGNGTLMAVGNGGVILTQTASTNNNLSALSLSSGTLNPPFNPATISYTASVPYSGTATIQVTATLADSRASMTINGADASSGVAKPVNLSVGANTIQVVVTAENGDEKTYTITVTRAAPSTNNDLSALTLSTGTLTPSFAAGTTSYSTVVPNGTASLNVTATTADSRSTLTIQGQSTTSGSARQVAVSTTSAPTEVHVLVTAESGAAKDYVVTIWPAPAFTSASANTSQLVSVGGSLAPLAIDSAALVTVSLTSGNLPAGITLNGDGTFAGVATTQGAYSAGLRVDNGHGGTATTTLAVTVQPKPEFTLAPENTNQTIRTGQGLKPLAVTAAAGETLTFSPLSALPPGITINVATGAFSGEATKAGTYTTTIRVTDTHQGVAQSDLTVTVEQGPVFTSAPTNTAQLVSKGAGLTALAATAPAGEEAHFAFTGGALPEGVVLNADGTFSGTVATVGTTNGTITVTDDHGGRATTNLFVEVQAAPAFTGAPANTAQLVSVGGHLQPLQATRAAGETLQFELTGGTLPDGIALNPDGTFAGTATTVGGPYNVTITASDQHGGVATTTLAVTVQVAPAYTAAPANTEQLVSAGAGLAPLQAMVAPDDTLTFALTGGALPPGISLNAATGAFAGTATSTGDYTASIVASDTHGGAATTTLHVTVQAAPAFTGAEANTVQLVSVGGGLTPLEATVATGDTLEFALVSGSLPGGITALNPNGTFAGSVTTVGGPTNLTIRAYDTHGGVATTILKVTVQAAPAFTAAQANTSQTIRTGAGLAPLMFSFAAGETLTFSVDSGSLPPGIDLDSATGALTRAATTAGSYNATIRLVDGHKGLATTTLAVTVEQGPLFTAAPTNTVQRVSQGAGLTPLAVTPGAPGDLLTFSVTGGALPAGISLNGNGTFAGTATATGDYTATIRVTDQSGGTATTTLAVTVQTGPAFTGDPTNTVQVVSVGGRLAPLTATVATGDTLEFVLVSGALPAGIAQLNANGTFDGTVTTVGGPVDLTIEARDAHGGVATTTLRVTVQPAPAFTGAPTNTEQHISTGVGLTALAATVASGDTLTFTVASGAPPTGISLNTATGAFTGTASTAGDYTAVIRAADTHQGVAETLLHVTVQVGPAFTGAEANTAQLVSVGGGLTALAATGAAGDTLAFVLTGGSLPPGITQLNPNGTFEGTVTTVGGPTIMTIEVRDSYGGVATTTLTVTVQAAPAFTGAEANTTQTIRTGAGLAPLAFTFAAGETLTFSVDSGSLPPGIGLDSATGALTGAATTAGSYSATIGVADGHKGVATTTLAVTVGQGPVFTAATANTLQRVSQGAGLTALAVTPGAPGDTLSFSVAGGALPAGITINADGTFTGTATAEGSYSATIQVTDQAGGAATTTLAVTVQNGPAFTGDAANTAQLVSVGGHLAALTATAATGDSVAYVRVGGSLPPGITQLNADGTFAGTVTTVGGPTDLTIEARDTHGGVATTTLRVTVQAAPAFTGAPANTAQRVSVGAGLAPLQVTVATGDTLTFSVTGGALPPGISLNAATGAFTGAATTTGTYAATIRATDTHQGAATTTLTVTVQVAPAFTGAAANQTQRVSIGTGLAALQATTAPGDSLTFTLAGGALPAGISLSPNGGFSGAVTTVGATTATIRAADTHGGVVTTTLTVTVQQAPAFALSATNTAQTTSTGAGLIPLTATAASGETLTFAVKGGTLPAGILLNSNGSFSGVATTAGVSEAIVEVADTHGGRALTVLRVTVLQGPVFTSDLANTRQGITTGESLLALRVTADSGVTVSFSLVGGSLPAGISLNANGTFSGNATIVGTSTAVIAATDNRGGRAVTSLTVYVSAPVPTPWVSVAGGVFTTQTPTIYGSAMNVAYGAPVTVTVGGRTYGATVQNGVWAAAVTSPLPVGTYTATASVQGPTGQVASASAAITIRIPPVVQAIADQSSTVGDRANLRIVATGATGSLLTYSAAGLPAGLSVSATTGAISGTLTREGSYTVVVTVRDTVGGGEASQTFTWRVQKPSPPDVEPPVGGRILVGVAAGGQPLPPDQALTHGETITAVLRRVDTGETQPLTIAPDGSIAVGKLTPGEYRIILQMKAPDGRLLAGAGARATVTADGQLNLGTILIDPYGTVTDVLTGKKVAGVKLTLLWADTALNRSKGRTPHTPVNLPVLESLAPNQNRVPQLTTAAGEYAWMVFPQGDYYIVAEKAGYAPYDSRQEGRSVAAAEGEDSWVADGIIHVGETIVRYDLQLTPKDRHDHYVSGYPDGTFGPDRPITRAEVATVLAKLTGAASDSSMAFSDVGAGHWAAGSISAVAARGLMRGDPDGSFRPDDPVTRAEVAVIVSRLRTLAPGTAVFPDVEGHWAAAYIAAAKGAGILSGYPDGTFGPEQATTRAEFVSIINRTLERGPLTGVPAATFPDVPLDHWASGQVEEAAVDHGFERLGDGTERVIR